MHYSLGPLGMYCCPTAVIQADQAAGVEYSIVTEPGWLACAGMHACIAFRLGIPAVSAWTWCWQQKIEAAHTSCRALFYITKGFLVLFE